jgi:hypothetical protein
MPPLELFSLEEEATLLPGGLFVSLFSLFHSARGTISASTTSEHTELLRIFNVSSVARWWFAAPIREVSKVC